MSGKYQGAGGGKDERREEEKAPDAPQGGLGILFLAAALTLALILTAVGVVAYFVMKR